MKHKKKYYKFYKYFLDNIFELININKYLFEYIK